MARKSLGSTDTLLAIGRSVFVSGGRLVPIATIDSADQADPRTQPTLIPAAGNSPAPVLSLPREDTAQDFAGKQIPYSGTAHYFCSLSLLGRQPFPPYTQLRKYFGGAPYVVFEVVEHYLSSSVFKVRRR